MHLLLLHSTKAQLPTRGEDEHEVKRLVGHEKRWKRQILHEDSPAPRIAQETLERQPCRLHFCYSSHEWTPQRPFLQIYLRDWRAAPPSLINDRNYSSVSSLACGRTSSRKMYWPLACVLDKQSRAGHALQFAHFRCLFCSCRHRLLEHTFSQHTCVLPLRPQAPFTPEKARGFALISLPCSCGESMSTP